MVPLRDGAFSIRFHKDLHFKDGNIILVAEGLCFRVHSGQLARHSEVFRGMMDIPQPVDALSIEGCPVVELHDSAQELTHLLTALYDGLYAYPAPTSWSGADTRCRFFTEGAPVDLPALSAILRLSAKYFFGCLRQRALARLRADWPLTLSDWDSRERLRMVPEGPDKPSVTRGNPVLIINLARELSLPSLLPPAFYDLSRYSPSQILRVSLEGPGCSRESLPGTDLMLVFRGMEAGQRYVSSFIAEELENRAPAPWCRHIHDSQSHICRDSIATVTYESLRHMSGVMAGRERDPLFTLQCIVDMQSRETGTDVAEKVTARSCEMCRADLRMATERARQAVWENIPDWFGLDASAVEDEIYLGLGTDAT